MTDIHSQEALSKWVREQFQRANKHLAEKGILFESVKAEDSRYLAPHVAVWKIKANDKKSYWVISGDVPADATLAESAANAREAIKRFSYLWQMQSENIRQSGTTDNTQLEFAKLLEEKANMLYQVSDDETLWQDQP
uniref:DUF4826 family protein n=1 Tax=Ningiella ruwaisensis TaxID=2364274 RepID=UPI00109F12F0|nr:DUF4826 family protein [Ningiella ruwaisensis]